MADQRQQESRQPVAQGIVLGILAGIVFLSADMVMNSMLGTPFFRLLRLISSVVLDKRELDPSYSFTAVVTVGLIIHVALSGLYGLIFGFVASWSAGSLATSSLLVYGSLFGFLLWLVNFYLIAPVAFPQFTQINQFWNGFVAHTFFYGTVLGWYLSLVRPRRLDIQESTTEKERRYG